MVDGWGGVALQAADAVYIYTAYTIEVSDAEGRALNRPERGTTTTTTNWWDP